MPYQTTTTSVRPSTSIGFFKYPKQFVGRSQASTTRTLRDDGLSETFVTVWSTQVVYDAWRVGISAVLTERDMYNARNDIHINFTAIIIE